MSYYCTTFCNFGHQVTTGNPLNHECFVLPTEALRLEQEGDIVRAIRVIQEAKPLHAHSGTRCRHEWVEHPDGSFRGFKFPFLRCGHCAEEREIPYVFSEMKGWIRK